ncbi:hypothetical protein CDAR_86401 [Caerostris darwini]|uniref:Uncharacterized protein n=1 Tax=Caerostris darwini TaxID=1538125 RepID=A0AAV4NPN0_9ARAC|nr:hypothetical protein CDAR_86401 [Caerostris darwini]
MEGHILNTRYGLDDENIISISQDAKDFALFKGISMRTSDLGQDVRVPIPIFALFHRLFYGLVQKVNDLQPYLNYIIHKIAHCKDILKECLSSTIEVDEFTRNIFKIYEAVEKDESFIGLIRSDYLLNSDSDGRITGIKQV